MAPGDFQFLARLLRRRCGLSLTPDRMALAERRLASVMRRFGFRNMTALIGELRLGREALAEAVTEAMSVNETSFYRDPALFERFRHAVLPRLMRRRAQDRRLRIWSAGCATGQEAYSIAIVLAEMGLAREGWSLDLIATDLSAAAIQRAQGGRYAACEIERGLDESGLCHFHHDGAQWMADDSLRRMIAFRRFNLLDSFGWLDDVDIVFCRNVLIYFDAASRADVLMRMADALAPDGVLLLGENESPEIAAFQASTDGQGVYAKTRVAIARAS